MDWVGCARCASFPVCVDAVCCSGDGQCVEESVSVAVAQDDVVLY